MDAEQRRAATILATFAAGANRDGLIKAVVDITKEVERHANAIDPYEMSSVGVLVDLVVELAQGMRHLANIMDTDAHPAPIIVEGPKWPANMLEPEVTP